MRATIPPPGEHLYRNIVDHAVDSIVVVDGSGTVRFINSATQKMFARGPEELLGGEFGFPVVAGETTELDIVHRNGKTVVAEMRVTETQWASERVLLALLRDITDRKLMEERLRVAHASLDELFNNMSSGVAVFRAEAGGNEFVLVNANRAVERIEKRERAALLGRRLTDLYPGLDPNVIPAAFRRVWQSGQPEHLPARWYQDERIAGWREYYVYRLPNDEVVAVYDDVTSHRLAEQALRLNARVFESSNEAIMICDVDGRIQSINRAFTRITGYTQEEAAGKTPSLLKSGRQGARFYQILWDTLRSHGYWRGEIWNRRKDGTIYPEWLSISSALGENGNVSHYIAIFSDISEQKEIQERLNYLAHFDALTGLPNRILLRDRLGHALASAQRKRGSLAVLFLDLDRFKHVNDSLGHHVGDQLLQQVAERLTGVVRESDTVSRLGGDEFIVLIQDIDQVAKVAQLARKIIESVARPYQVDGTEISLTTSVGISIFPNDGSDIDGLIKNADAAMYGAKDGGRNTYRFFTRSMNAHAKNLLSMANSLRRALDTGEFRVHYQPQISLTDGRVIAAEALIRWQRPGEGLVSPAHFIPLAEDNGLIVPIGEWVLNAVCEQARIWQGQGLRKIPLSVNISATQFRRPDFMATILRILEATRLDPALLELELTESVFLQDADHVVAMVRELREMGTLTSIDDFGIGFSSLNYLKALPLAKLKIDQSFIRDVNISKADAAIVKAIIGLAHNLEVKVIAEGVETGTQLALLRDHGCDQAQGYLFSHPLPAEEFAQLLRESHDLSLPRQG